jgi:phage terminase large subunit-like protein
VTPPAKRERFHAPAADHAQEFYEELLVHTKSPYARQPFLLAPFQREDMIRPLFGEQVWAEDLETWVRRYTLAWWEVARKNGKSELLAGAALYLTGADDEEGAEVYGVAKDTDQAALVFDVARRMLELADLGGPPRSGKPFTIYPTNKRIVYAKTGSFYRVIAADALGNLGQNPHGIIFDEVIAQPNAELWDALRTGYGTRAQPLMIAATTAGDDTTDFARQEHEFSLRVAADPTLDPRRFVYIRGVPNDADWTDESRWAEANPALDIFLRRQVLRDELISAQNNPREERRFRMFRLNQWQAGGLKGWAGAEWWRDEGNAGMVPEEKLAGQPCWGGIMAASASDLAAAAWLFRNPEGNGVWARWAYFMPEDRFADLERRTSGAATAWRNAGHLQLTEGNELDIPAIVQHVREAVERYAVREIAYFSGNALGIAQPLMADRLAEMVSIGASAPGSSLVDWERMLSRGEFNHGGHPVSAWQVSQLQVRDTTGGVPRIDMKASPENVYGIVAAELALRRLLVAKAPPRSAYSHDRGLMQV